MEKAKNSSVWTEVGYNLFAEEGLDGIQVERLARILQLNKSGFYHYFGDLEVFGEQLIRLHEKKAALYFSDLQKIKTIDPDYLHLIVQYKTPVMFHLQLIRSKDNPLFYKTAEKIDERVAAIVQELWTDYLGIHENPNLAMRYFNIVRDMVYARISFQNLEYPFLHKLISEARVVIQQIIEAKEIETDKSGTKLTMRR